MFKFIYTVVALVTYVGSFAPQSAQAATYRVSIEGGGCNVNESGDSGREVSCDTNTPLLSYARSTNGSLGIAAGAFQQYNEGRQTASADTRAHVTFSDVLNFGIDSGTFQIPLDFAGGIEFSEYTPGTPSPAVGELSWSVNANGQTVGDRQTLSISPGREELSGSISSLTNAVFSFENGTLGLNAFLFARGSCGNLGNDGSLNTCLIQAEAQNSLRFLGGTVRDVDGNIRNDAFLNSSSGFDYTVGVAPHVAAVPLPSSVLLLGIGLLGFGATSRFRRK